MTTMPERNANQLAAVIQSGFGDSPYADEAATALDELVGLVGTLQQENSVFAGRIAALNRDRSDEHEARAAAEAEVLRLLEGRDYSAWAARAQAAEAALAEMTADRDRLILVSEAHYDRIGRLRDALATTRQALADFLAPWGPEHYPQLRRALADTGGDTKPETCTLHVGCRATEHDPDCPLKAVT